MEGDQLLEEHMVRLIHRVRENPDDNLIEYRVTGLGVDEKGRYVVFESVDPFGGEKVVLYGIKDAEHIGSLVRTANARGFPVTFSPTEVAIKYSKTMAPCDLSGLGIGQVMTIDVAFDFLDDFLVIKEYLAGIELKKIKGNQEASQCLPNQG